MADLSIAFVNNKGGVGKTTLAVIFTQIAIMDNKKITAIDLDEQCNFKSTLKRMLETDQKFAPQIKILNSLSDNDIENFQEDMTVIDCPPYLNEQVIKAIELADIVIIPVRPDYYSLMNLSSLYNQTCLNENDKAVIIGIGFDNLRASKIAGRVLKSKGYMCAGNLPIYGRISYNIASNQGKWWCTGLTFENRQPFEDLYNYIQNLHAGTGKEE